MADMINNPSHYQSKKGIEVIEVIEAFELDFCRGNAIKYILRAGKKSDNIEEDIEKAVWYLYRYLQNIVKGSNTQISLNKIYWSEEKQPYNKFTKFIIKNIWSRFYKIFKKGDIND